MPLAEPPPNCPSMPNLRKDTKQLSLGMHILLSSFPPTLSPCSGTFLKLQSSEQSLWTQGMVPPILWGTGKPCWEISLCFPLWIQPWTCSQPPTTEAQSRQTITASCYILKYPKIKVVHSVSHLSGQSSHRFSPTVPVFWNANSITTYAKAAHEYI